MKTPIIKVFIWFPGTAQLLRKGARKKNSQAEWGSGPLQSYFSIIKTKEKNINAYMHDHLKNQSSLTLTVFFYRFLTVKLCFLYLLHTVYTGYLPFLKNSTFSTYSYCHGKKDKTCCWLKQKLFWIWDKDIWTKRRHLKPSFWKDFFE